MNTHEIYGSDLICKKLKDNGIDYIAINPGSSVGGIHESLVHEKNGPSMLLCLHEEIAVAAAHGYTKASGKIMGVAVHANVGLYHASMAVFNAWCDRAPILIIGGSGPLDADKRRPWIDWIHASSHQANIISDCVKWHDTPLSLTATIESISRGVELAKQEPTGPIYLTISSTIQEEICPEELALSRNNINSSEGLAISSETINKIIAVINKSSKPVIIVDYMDGKKGRDQELISFAENIGAAVLDLGGRYNFPSSHHLCVSGNEPETISNSDCIILLDVQDPHGTLGFHNLTTKKFEAYNKEEAKLICIGTRDLLTGSAYADYHKHVEFDLKVIADSGTTVSQVNKELKNQILNQDKVYARTERIKLERKRFKEECHLASDYSTCEEINIPQAVAAIWNIAKKYKFALTNCGGLSVRAWVKRIFEFDNKNSVFVGINSGGAGLGYGLGASFGASLALKDGVDLCINIQNDGDLLYTPSALWSIAHYEVPLLIIVFNNKSYGLTKAVSKRVANARKRQTDIEDGNCFVNPEIDFSAMAKSYGIKTTPPILKAKDLEEKLLSAIEIVKKEKKPFLIEIVLEN